MIRIGIIVGSTRPGRRGLPIAEWVHACARERTDLDARLVDLEDHDLPNLVEPVPAMAGRYLRPQTRAWSDVIAGLDGFVLVTPEYNHGTSGALKNALDHLYAEWTDKAVGFVSYGMEGGQRAVEQLRLVTAELQLAAVRRQVGISLPTDFVGDAFSPPAERRADLDGMLDQLVRWTTAMRALRRSESTSPGDDAHAPQPPATPRGSQGAPRPALHRSDRAALAAVHEFTATLQAGLDRGDADVYDSRFGADVLWGSPYGDVVDGIHDLLPIHRRLMGSGAAPPSRFELVGWRAPLPGVVVAQIRRRALAPDGFSEVALYTLVERGGRWWLAAAQNTPITAKPTPGVGQTAP